MINPATMVLAKSLTAAQILEIKNETPKRIFFSIDGQQYYYTKEASDAHHAKEAAYLAATPEVGELVDAQNQVSMKTAQLVANATLEPEEGVFLKIANVSEWLALISFPEAAFPYAVGAYTVEGLHCEYVIPTLSSAKQLFADGLGAHQVIKYDDTKLKNEIGAATSRAALQAIKDMR